jgi:hypothetical protein
VAVITYTKPAPLFAIVTDDTDDDEAPLCTRDPAYAQEWAERETNRTGIQHKVVEYA